MGTVYYSEQAMENIARRVLTAYDSGLPWYAPRRPHRGHH